MPIPKELFVKQLLKPYEPVFCDLVLRAWERLLKNPERSMLYRRTQATLMHNYVMLDAIPRLKEDKGIRIIEQYETALFVIEEQLVLRIKKGNEIGLSSNIPTQAALAFNDPEENLDLFGLPDIGRVDISYTLNDLCTLIHTLQVVARDEDRLVWRYAIYPSDAVAAPLPSVPVPPKEYPPADQKLRAPSSAEKEEKQKKAE